MLCTPGSPHVWSRTLVVRHALPPRMPLAMLICERKRQAQYQQSERDKREKIKGGLDTGLCYGRCVCCCRVYADAGCLCDTDCTLF